MSGPTTLVRRYVYDGVDVVAEYEEQDGKATRTRYYYRDDGRIVAQENIPTGGVSNVLWYHYDGMGSVVALSDSSGASTETYQYDEYGVLQAGDVHVNHYLYTGQEWDAEMGTYHFPARDYDPLQGVWLQQDVYRGSTDDPLSLHLKETPHARLPPAISRRSSPCFFTLS